MFLFKKIVINSSLQFIERILSMGLSFISSIFIIRYFNKTDYGIISYANSYIAVFSILANLGINSIIIRELVKNKDNSPKLIGTGFFILFIGSILTSVVVILSSIIYNPRNITTILIIFSITTIINSLSIINNYFQFSIKTSYLAIAMIIQDMFDFLSKLLLIKFKCNILVFASQTIISSIILYSILYYFYLKKLSPQYYWKIDLKLAKYILQQSIPLAISGMMISIYTRIDQIMLMYYYGLTKVAEYNVSIKLLELVYIFPMILIPNIFPILIQNFKTSAIKFEILFIKILRYICLIGFIITLLIFILSPYMINLIYGVKYLNAGYFLRYLSLCIIPVFIGVVSSLWQQINNLQNKQFYQTVIGLFICIILNFILIPKYNCYGAIASLVIAQICNAIISPLFFKQLRPLFYCYIKIFQFKQKVRNE
jgi:O-antigen/teichoic acid export membrane protein